MSLSSILYEVGNLVVANWSTSDIQESIFLRLQRDAFEVDTRTKNILFFEGGEIRYRSVFSVNNNYITNDYGFIKHTSEVVAYNADPRLLKEEINAFITGLDGEYTLKNRENNLADANIVTGRDFEMNTIKRENKMKDVFNKMLEVNKESAINTAKVELGKSANKLVLAKITPQLPMMVRGYADSPLSELVVANVVAGMLMQFAPNNEKAKVLSEAMIAAGAQVAIESFDIPGLVNDLLANVDISGLTEDD